MEIALHYCCRYCCINDNNINDIWIKRNIANFVQFQSWAAQRLQEPLSSNGSGSNCVYVYTGVYTFAGLNSSFCGFQFLLLINWTCSQLENEFNVVRVSESRSYCRCGFVFFQLDVWGRCSCWLQTDSMKWVIITNYFLSLHFLNA